MAKNSGKKYEIDQQVYRILEVLRQSHKGASLNEIKVAAGLDLETRSLQRRLEKLKAEGVVYTSGNVRSTLYHISSLLDKGNIANDSSVYKKQPSEIPLSLEGREIESLVSRPVTNRIPVGYQPDFLLNYRPNIDMYLSDDEKHMLTEIGQTNTSDQPAGTYARSVLERLLIDLSWNSSRLEGNTYSLLDTQYLISQGKKADYKNEADTQMILNHKEAIEFIVQGADEINFNSYTITNLHALLADNLLPDPAAAGRLRTFGVGITNSVFTPLAMPQLIEDMFRRMLDKLLAIADPFEQAFFIMVHLPYLQPFDDVNKRVSRLAANIPLNRHNLSPMAFVDVPEELYIKGLLGVYELNRIDLLKDVFLWSYRRSALRYAAIRQSLGEPDTWRMRYRDEIRHIVREVVVQTMNHQEALAAIGQYSERIVGSDRQKFIDVVDMELLSLHEGNFARFRIKPSEFKSWHERWKNA